MGQYDVARITKIVITVGGDGDYYAAMFAANGEEIFRTSEGYFNLEDCKGACQTSWPYVEIVGPV